MNAPLLGEVSEANRDELDHDTMSRRTQRLDQPDDSRAPSTLGDVAPALVHDLKGPLSAITMNVEFALDQLPQREDLDAVRGALLDCRHAGERLFRMIANLLDVARGEAGQLTPHRAQVDVGALVRELEANLAVELAMRRVVFEAVVDDELARIDTDPDLLMRVLQTIVENALRVARPKTRLRIHAFVRNGTPHLRVANDGPPIANDVLPFLFRRNVRPLRTGAGTSRGLGLYFCRMAMHALGGEIRLADEPGFTVCFELSMPAPRATISP